MLVQFRKAYQHPRVVSDCGCEEGYVSCIGALAEGVSRTKELMQELVGRFVKSG